MPPRLPSPYTIPVGMPPITLSFVYINPTTAPRAVNGHDSGPPSFGHLGEKKLRVNNRLIFLGQRSRRLS